MSNYHVMRTSEDGGAIGVIMHVSVPNENNAIGQSIRTAVADDPHITHTSVVPWIEAAEQTQLTNGELIEKSITFPTHVDIDNTIKRDRMDALYTAEVAGIQACLRNRYLYWRFNRNVP